MKRNSKTAPKNKKAGRKERQHERTYDICGEHSGSLRTSGRTGSKKDTQMGADRRGKRRRNSILRRNGERPRKRGQQSHGGEERRKKRESLFGQKIGDNKTKNAAASESGK